MTGAPVFDYYSRDQQGEQVVFDGLHLADQSNYLMTAATWFDHEDYWNGIYTNDCGIKAGHAYSLISAFELTQN